MRAGAVTASGCPPRPRLERGPLGGCQSVRPALRASPGQAASCRALGSPVLPFFHPRFSPSLLPNCTCFRRNAPILSPFPGFDGKSD